MSSATDAQGPQIVTAPATIDLSKMKPIGWYARIGDKFVQKNLITGEMVVTPHIPFEDGDDE